MPYQRLQSSHTLSKKQRADLLQSYFAHYGY